MSEAYKIIDHTYDTVVVGAGGSGLRHLVLDMGAGYELTANRNWALAAFIAAIFATALVALFVASRSLGIS